jgi:hypothetical protein
VIRSPRVNVKWAWVSVASVAAAFIVFQPWRFLSTDVWLALVCGREIVEHGLPHVDALTAGTLGKTWTDQQWLAQLLIYLAERAAGLRFAIVLQGLVTGATFGICARYALKNGASLAATFVYGVAGFALGATFFTLRPQMFSLVGFAALLVLLGADARKPSLRVFWTIPILCIWANLHGVVILGALFVGLRGAFDVLEGLRARDARRAGRGILLGALAAPTPLCSPYALALPRYFREIGHLQDPARELPIQEWNRVNWPSDIPYFAVGLVTLALLAFVHWKKEHRPAPFETLVLALTAIAPLQASRHLQWFGLVIAAYAPCMLDSVSAIRDGRVLARVASAMRYVGPLVFVALSARLYAISDDSLEREYPRDVLPVLAKAAAEHPESTVAISDYFADWALWYLPELRGRVQFDVRFELLDTPQARAMGTFSFAKPGWEALYPDAKLVLVARRVHGDLDHGLAAHGGRVLYTGTLARLFLR